MPTPHFSFSYETFQAAVLGHLPYWCLHTWAILQTPSQRPQNKWTFISSSWHGKTGTTLPSHSAVDPVGCCTPAFTAKWRFRTALLGTMMGKYYKGFSRNAVLMPDILFQFMCKQYSPSFPILIVINWTTSFLNPLCPFSSILRHINLPVLFAVLTAEHSKRSLKLTKAGELLLIITWVSFALQISGNAFRQD